MILSTLLLIASLFSAPADEVAVASWPPLPPGCPPGTFVENCGQWPAAIDYLARVEGAWVRIEQAAIVLQIDAGSEPSLVRVQADDADLYGADEIFVEDLHALLHVPGATWEVRPDGSWVAVQCDWSVTDSGVLRLGAPGWTGEPPLVVDSELTWSTYLGSAYAGGRVMDRRASRTIRLVTS